MKFQDWKSDFLQRVKQKADASTLAQCAPLMVEHLSAAKADTNQAETRKTLKQYLAITVSQKRIETGQSLLRKWADTFAKIETHFGVDRHIVAAIWGMETNFGQIRGDIPTFAALATLAAQGRRQSLFEDQLIAAMEMIQDGQATPDQMIGSWAGAMGHTQFMPRSYRNFAIPNANIWSDDPTDALASTANYLFNHGWVFDEPAMVAATYPASLNLKEARHNTPQSLAAWHQQDVKTTSQHQITAPLSFQLPAGHKGPAILTSANFNAILKYNNATAYAVAISHLANHLAGKPTLDTNWQDDPRGLTQTEVQNIQTKLTTLGFNTQGADGFPGPNTTKAVENFQTAHCLPVDGHVDLALLHLISSC